MKKITKQEMIDKLNIAIGSEINRLTGWYGDVVMKIDFVIIF